jgi:hypothetical protein
MGRLFDDYGVNLGRIGANPNESLVGGASVEPEISEIPQDNALGGYAAMELDHLALVIEPDGAELKFAESCDFNNLLQMNAVGTPRKIRNWFFNFGSWTTGAFHCDRTYWLPWREITSAMGRPQRQAGLN